MDVDNGVLKLDIHELSMQFDDDELRNNIAYIRREIKFVS